VCVWSSDGKVRPREKQDWAGAQEVEEREMGEGEHLSGVKVGPMGQEMWSVGPMGQEMWSVGPMGQEMWSYGEDTG
jgi:hypothetical protein